jgi:MFS family permease
MGALSDRLGRLGLTAVGLSLGIITLLLMPVMTTFLLLAGVMALYGIAYGTIFPSISAMVADQTAPEERGMATGIFHALLTAGVAIGAPVVGWVGGVAGIQIGLILSAGIMVIALLVTLVTMKRI